MREKGLVTIERFLGCAESAVLLSDKPISLQNEQPACDKRATCKYIVMSRHDRDSSQRLQLAKTCILDSAGETTFTKKS